MNNEEVLIPKMQRIDKKKRKIKIPLLNVVIILFAILMIIGSTFVNIQIRHYFISGDAFSGETFDPNSFIYNFYIIPQIPMLMFLCAILGRKMISTAVIVYIIAGLLFLPIFALGGGLSYVKEFSFGYIIGYIPAVNIAGHMLKEKYSFKNMILASIFGVLTIHIIGIIYMLILALLKQEGVNFIAGWIHAQSGLKIIYDLVISFVLVLIGKYIRPIVKFITE